jgi:phage tail tape-measure protein
MKNKEEIEQEIKELEERALERIRQGYATLKYAIVFRLQALKWVLEDTQVETGKECL